MADAIWPTRGSLVAISMALLVGVLAPRWAAAQDVTLNLQEAEIRALIDTVAEITGKNFIVDPRVNAKVTVISSSPMSSETIYDVFLSVLQVHGFTTIDTGRAVKIVPIDSARTSETAARMGSDEEFVTRVIEVVHVDAGVLVPTLQPLVPQEAHLAAVRPGNAIVVTDRAGNVDRLARIIASIDQPADEEVEIIALEHAVASETETIVADLMSAQAGATGFAVRGDPRTNSILLRGNGQALVQMRTIVRYLDAPRTGLGNTRVVYLRHAIARDLAEVLEGVVEANQPVGEGDRNQAPPARIQADESVNALIITAPPDIFETLADVIDRLDVRRRQVLVEAVIAEISVDRAAELGVQWRSTTEPDDNTVFGGTNFSLTGQGINQLSVNPLLAGDGLSLGYIEGTVSVLGQQILNLGALVRALDADNATNILSTPSIVTLDNQEASIIVGQNVPFVTGQFTATGAAQGATTPFQTIVREDVGITLRVRPQINDGDTVLLELTQEVSSISATATGAVNASDLITDKRSISTSVLVDDGRIVVLGGLIEDDLEELNQRVPVLGDIPLLGRLFRFDRTNKVKRNLMVFLTPRILADRDSYTRVSKDKYESVRSTQEQRSQEGVELMPEERQPLLEPLSEP